ncbi:MAG: cytochrome c3 family protein [Thermodesulfobacteriota bacterium]|nr:MAG: cytochrome c3 family protein [Thermodesulfobacteriota bacterium]
MTRLFAIAIISLLFIANHANAGTFEGDYSIGAAANGIGYSRHNLGGTGRFTKTVNTFEVCVFCHTPHHSNQDTEPLWNRSTSQSVNYSAYGTTLAGTETESATIAIGSPSLACLSCHDGATTFDNLANSPGKGGVTFGGGTQGWSFFSSETQVPNILSGTSLVIGTTLTNDHPVNILFRGGQAASLRPSTTIISQIDLSTGLISTSNTNIRQNLWSVQGFISDTATIKDLLRDGRIECPSCHDPHFNNKSWTEVQGTFLDWDDMDGLFLRRVGGNTGSGVCRTCHNK